MDKEEYSLLDMWLNFQLMQNHRGEFTFVEEGEFYTMVDKCLKIVNKALSVKGVRKRLLKKG